MNVNNGLNTKEITRCTMRIYDHSFARDLSVLYQKIGGLQNDFFLMLMKEGYRSLSPLYQHQDLPVNDSLKRVQGDEIERLGKELKDLINSKSAAELKFMDGLSEDNETLVLILSCIYRLFILN